ncbi:unnamed protein product [Symbiodinium sp. CCMP2592]|nr:unnamed protein product [Symbiodinium sp. CCMP2592]
MDPSNRRALLQALGLGIEFAFHGKVIVNTKPKKVWSQVRPLLQDIIHKGLAKSRASLPSSMDSGLERLTENLSRDALTAGSMSPGEKSILLWMTEPSASCVRKWLTTNHAVNACDHAAFCAARSKLVSRMCKCKRDPTSCPVHADASVSLSDLVWWASDAIFEHIPCAVPTFSLALTVKFSDKASLAASNQCVPPYSHFLCKEESVAGEPFWVPNSGVLEVLIRMRAVYLLRMLQGALQTVARGGAGNKEPCKFTDFVAAKLDKVCHTLLAAIEATDSGNSATGSTDIPTSAKLEVLLTTVVADESEWATGWTKHLTKCLSLIELGSASEDEIRDKMHAIQLQELGLDVPSKFRYLLGDSVKSEVASPAARKASAGLQGNASASVDGGSVTGVTEDLSVSSVYVFHETKEAKWNVLDVMSLQMQISAHLLAKALSAVERTSMECLYINYAQGAKNAVTVDISQMDETFSVAMFGQVVLDAGPKHSHLLASRTRKV